MLARIRKSMEEKDQGFTLIELLVVMIIIGILAAIAIPVFLNQRKKAVDSATKSDLRTVANEMETYFTDNQKYILPTQASAGAPVKIDATDVKVSADTNMTFKLLDNAGAATTDATKSAGFCLGASNARGSDSTKLAFVYNSMDGGLKQGAAATVKCP